jgi:glycosyltransferase involved in cell wall biosynthesis
LIDDGSKDNTADIIRALNNSSPLFSGIFLSKNKGHQNALLAGLHYASDKCDCAISLDCDLQDDINAIDDMLNKYSAGCDIVYGVRSSRKKDSLFKKLSAKFFYKTVNLLGGEVVDNHADYRLMSKKALGALKEFKEVNLFLRGIVPMLGFKTDVTYYERTTRVAGKSKYPLRKMLSFASEGITSLSTRPLNLIIGIGSFITLVSFVMLIYSLVQHFSGNTEAGWTSTFVSIWFLGGIQLIAIGVIGKYVGKIYLETKHRPPYIIEEIIE